MSGIEQIDSGHAHAFVFQCCYNSRVLLGFLEDGLEEFVKFVCHLSSVRETESLNVFCHTLFVVEQRKVISHAAHGHVAVDDFCSTIGEAHGMEVLFSFTEVER